MKVVLIKLTSNFCRNMPDYGLACLAGYLGARTDWTVEVSDLAPPDVDLDAFIERRLRGRRPGEPAIVGVSANSDDLPVLRRLYPALLRRCAPEDLLVIGGPHPTVAPEDVAEFPRAVFVVGEGEETLLDLGRALEQGRATEEVRGTAFVRDGAVVVAPPRPFLKPEDIPSPLWTGPRDLESEFNPLFYMALRRKRALTGVVASSRGCANDCAFCHKTFGRLVRRRPIPAVLREIEDAVALGATEIAFNDDLLISQHGHLRRLMDAIASLGLKVPLTVWNGIRGDVVDERDLEAMSRAGVRHVLIPIESSSVRLQRAMNKRLDPAKVKRAWSMARAAGMLVQTNLIFGYPGATEAELRDDISFVQGGDLHGVTFGMPGVHKGHRLFDQVMEVRPDLAKTWTSFTHYERTFRNFTTCSDAVYKDLLRRMTDATLKKLIAPEAVERLRFFDLVPNPSFLRQRVRFIVSDIDAPTATA